jgi:hypothetical protein
MRKITPPEAPLPPRLHETNRSRRSRSSRRAASACRPVNSARPCCGTAAASPGRCHQVLLSGRPTSREHGWPAFGERRSFFRAPRTGTLELASQSEDSVRAAWQHSQHRKLRQAISKLVGNAVKFSPDGGEVLIDVERERERLGPREISPLGPKRGRGLLTVRERDVPGSTANVAQDGPPSPSTSVRRLTARPGGRRELHRPARTGVPIRGHPSVRLVRPAHQRRCARLEA